MSVRVFVTSESILGIACISKCFAKATVTAATKKLQLETILHLIKTTLPVEQKDTVAAVIDIPRGKLIIPTVETHNMPVYPGALALLHCPLPFRQIC